MPEDEKGFHRVLVAIEEPDAAERSKNSDGNDEREWVVVVVVEAGGTHCNGGDEADDGEQRHQCENRSDECAGALREIARDFDGKPQAP